MPLKLNVGVTKKLGQREFSSIGASCSLELELAESLLHADLDAFHAQVRDAYVACHQAVHDELARLQALHAPPGAAPAATAGGNGHRNGSEVRPDGGPARPGGARGHSAKPATARQLKAIQAISRTQHADLDGLLRDEFQVGRPEDLTLSQASALIDQLKAAASV
jgi:hypothetical protein